VLENTVKIAIVGGGPSGLYLGILLKRQRPRWEVDVFEQNQADDTFGFGVVLADTGLAQLQEADEESYDALCAAMRYNHRQIIVHRETPIEYELHVRGGAIPRLTLLQILNEAAETTGVSVHYGRRLETADGLEAPNLADADVVVGADGINSAIRRQFATHFGTTEYSLTNHFAWYGTEKVFDCPALVFRKHRGGHFVAHYYAYSDTMSTFVAECDDATWRNLDLGALTDDQRQALFEEIFAPELDGHPLVSNKSVWRQFPVVRNRHWFHDRYVLIGDALASAHYSIGSGTRIAMSDSIALSRALLACDGDIPAGLAAFETRHRAEKAKLIEASEHSYNWYERMADWMDQYTPEEFVYRFMTRTGRISDARLRAQFSSLMSRLEPQLRLQ
jgi:2-polyprenyl-6-methoxyphenol hydroxylase-like FAD-dependent oxidoreductase